MFRRANGGFGAKFLLHFEGRIIKARRKLGSKQVARKLFRDLDDVAPHNLRNVC
jgi:hypothetical protein